MSHNIEMTSKCSFTIPGLGCTVSSLLVGCGVGLASFFVGVLLLLSCGRLLHCILGILRRSRRPPADGLEWGERPAIAVLPRSQRVYDGLSTLDLAAPPSYREAMAMDGRMAVGVTDRQTDRQTDTGGSFEDLPPPYVEIVESSFSVRGRQGAV